MTLTYEMLCLVIGIAFFIGWLVGYGHAVSQIKKARF